MKLDRDNEVEQFIEIATMLKFYKMRGVPIPANVRDLIEQDCENNEVCRVLYDIMHE